MSALERYYKSSPPAAKTAIVIGGLALTTYVIWQIAKNRDQKEKDKEANQAGAAAAKQIKELEKQGQRRTLTDYQLDQLVTAFYQAVDGCGTDEDAVYNVFRKLNNNMDLLYLTYRFGIQYYMPCAAYSPISYAKWMINRKSFPADLTTYINYELSQSEIEKINQILISRGINYLF